MRTTSIAKQLASVADYWLLYKLGKKVADKGRSGLDDLSHEMCTCAAYFSLLSSIVENSARSEMRRGAARLDWASDAEPRDQCGALHRCP